MILPDIFPVNVVIKMDMDCVLVGEAEVYDKEAQRML